MTLQTLAGMSVDVTGDAAPIDIIRIARLRAALYAHDYRIDLYRIASAIFDVGSKPSGD